MLLLTWDEFSISNNNTWKTTTYLKNIFHYINEIELLLDQKQGSGTIISKRFD
jgi:hypothetical protein